MLPFTDGFSKMMNFNNVFRWHYPFLLLLLLLARVASADTLLVLGDSLSAGYRMSAGEARPRCWIKVAAAAAGGERQHQRRHGGAGPARLPALLQQHKPRWVLIELGGNDGLRGFPPQNIEQDLRKIITTVQAANAEPLLMQIRLPANYGRRYTEAFSNIYPKLAQQYNVPLVPFYGTGLSSAPMDAAGRHSSGARCAGLYYRADG